MPQIAFQFISLNKIDLIMSLQFIGSHEKFQFLVGDVITLVFKLDEVNQIMLL